MLGVSEQLRGLRAGLWSNALGVSSDEDYEIFVNVPTLTLTLKMLMFNISLFLRCRFV